jgi:hypothetical protein
MSAATELEAQLDSLHDYRVWQEETALATPDVSVEAYEKHLVGRRNILTIAEVRSLAEKGVDALFQREPDVGAATGVLQDIIRITAPRTEITP